MPTAVQSLIQNDSIMIQDQAFPVATSDDPNNPRPVDESKLVEMQTHPQNAYSQDDLKPITDSNSGGGSNIKSARQTAEDDENEEINKLRKTITESTCPEELKASALDLIKRLERMTRTGVYSREYEILRNYVDWVVQFPWNKRAEEILDIDKVKKVLDEAHYGLEGVKERVLEYLAIRKLLSIKKDFKAMEKSPVICMVGLQGIGKTTMAKSIARALNRPFYRISMGAIGSVLEIRGKNKSNEGAEPGQIVKAIVRTGVRNPIILLDELDKASGQTGLLADVMATMLEILDPEQNTTFRDHYIDYPIDLSEVMFIVSANKIGTFSAALMDRMEMIRMPSYTDVEKQVIARDYLLPRVRAATGMGEDQLGFHPEVWPLLIRPLGFDSGIRSLQRIVESMARKAALEIVKGTASKVLITPENYKEYLPQYS
jgi:ATP-dependent Lon protease